ncbi:hypothetical protein B0H13DRAFT_1873228 [Mycena leptocephala]|nr:hypothetical protein B0H13DRAFT_1873228 [Mycena leptocephala]
MDPLGPRHPAVWSSNVVPGDVDANSSHYLHSITRQRTFQWNITCNDLTATTSVRKLPGRCTGTTSWSNEHDVTAYWDYQPGRELGTSPNGRHNEHSIGTYTATRNSGINAGTAETVSARHNRQ